MLKIKTVPSQALFGPRDASRFLGISTDTLLRMTQGGELTAYWFRNRKVYRLEDLEEVLGSLKRYNPGSGEEPCVERSTHGH